ncbi:MAG: metalloregulator ArsR/SmtB family transcription factor [Robiginitomaculum sp.]
MSANAADAADVLKALSNETRIMLMCQLMDGEKSVNTLADAVKMRLPAVSQHLSRMRSSGLVTSRRAAQTVYYSAKGEIGKAIVGTLCQYFK